LLQLQEELIPSQFLAQRVRLRRIKLDLEVKCEGRADLNLLLDGLRGIQPVLDIVVIGELKAKVVFLDEI
jgi:hypothetical protein